MCPSAQREAAAAGHQRAALVALPALQQLQAVLPATAAKRLGIRVIRKDACGNVAVGAFDVPPLQSGMAACLPGLRGTEAARGLHSKLLVLDCDGGGRGGP